MKHGYIRKRNKYLAGMKAPLLTTPSSIPNGPLYTPAAPHTITMEPSRHRSLRGREQSPLTAVTVMILSPPPLSLFQASRILTCLIRHIQTSLAQSFTTNSGASNDTRKRPDANVLLSYGGSQLDSYWFPKRSEVHASQAQALRLMPEISILRFSPDSYKTLVRFLPRCCCSALHRRECILPTPFLTVASSPFTRMVRVALSLLSTSAKSTCSLGSVVAGTAAGGGVTDTVGNGGLSANRNMPRQEGDERRETRGGRNHVSYRVQTQIGLLDECVYPRAGIPIRALSQKQLIRHGYSF